MRSDDRQPKSSGIGVVKSGSSLTHLGESIKREFSTCAVLVKTTWQQQSPERVYPCIFTDWLPFDKLIHPLPTPPRLAQNKQFIPFSVSNIMLLSILSNTNLDV
uniref:Uncharacterized protein n=1 Tax=Physcomitrium patens TaxID=3218 RepID=A0A2K1J323_PHYPA|nr:hypothetical protein PHYPA_021773 [Physcomitrium patens]